MLRALIAAIVKEALEALHASGRLSAAVTSEIEVADPRNPEHGDFALNIALVVAKGFGMNPRQFAELLVAELSGREEFTSVEVAGPGFVNLRLSPAFVGKPILEFSGKLHEAGDDPGKESSAEDVVLMLALMQHQLPEPKSINVEFVSVNPNGPITIGSGRGAAFGSALCNVLSAVGHEVWREYYINDGINSEQMRLFAESVRSIVKGEPVPEKGYKGDYVQHAAEELLKRISHSIESGGLAGTTVDVRFTRRSTRFALMDTLAHEVWLELPTNENGERSLDPAYIVANQPTNLLQAALAEEMVSIQEDALFEFGVQFNQWFKESFLINTNRVERDVAELQAKGLADEEAYRTVHKMGRGGKIEETTREEQPNDEEDVEGTGKTLWLRSSLLGDDMDRVLRRRDGRLTYIASDVAYHKDKFNRPPNADRLITILGPDHHGYIARLRAVVAAMLAKPGQDPADALKETDERFEVIIYQLVRFLKDGQPAPMRKRDGNIYALIDLLKEIGQKVKPDAPEEEQLRSGKDVARFFYLQRSHDSMFDFDLDLAARQSDENPVFYVQYAHARICSVLRKASEANLTESAYTPDQLSHPKELALGKLILDLPNEVRRVATDYGVHRIATYAVELARAYHGFYDSCRVIQPDQPALTAARLDLCRAAAKALREALALIGVDAPERMERSAPEATLSES